MIPRTLLIYTLACLPLAAAPGEATITVRGHQVVHTMRGGIGASWHAIGQEIPSNHPHPEFGGPVHGGSAWGANPPADDDARWRQIERHADWLGLDFIRLEVEHRMWQPERDQFTWDTPEMRVLYRILDWCESRKADVFLQVMWGNTRWNAHPEFRDDPVARVHSGPHDMQAFGEGVAALAKHLSVTRKYSCIRWICITNEPGFNWSWWQEPPNRPMSLRAGLAAVRAALDRQGVSIPLSGPDWTDLPALDPAKIDFDEFIGAYDLHSYYSRYDWEDNGGYRMADAEHRLAGWRGWAAAKGKPFFLSEMGSMVYGWRNSHPGPARFESALKNAQMLVRGLNLGVDGFSRWSFVNRGDLDGKWQMINTWNPETRSYLADIKPQPNDYFVYGLVSRFAAKYSQIINSETDGGRINGVPRVFTTVLRSPSGDWNLITVNDAPEPAAVRFQLQNLPASRFHQYQVSMEQRDNPDLQIEPLRAIEISKDRPEFRETLPPMSLTIHSTRQLAHKEPGITAQ